MKYIAILKDSLREAIDTKVFFVMLALSALLIAVVGSVSFRPVSVEDDLKAFTSFFNTLMSWAARQQPDGGPTPPRMEFADFKQTNETAHPWEGDYSFTFIVELPDAELARPGRRPRELSAPQIRQMLRQRFGYLENLEVKEATSPEPKQIRFSVTSKGTKISNFRGWKYEPSLFFGAVPMSIFQFPLGLQVYFIQDILVNGIGAWITILTGIVLTAFFIPNMLRKGTVDLLLVKPMSRVTLLLFKFIGGLTFIFLTTSFIVAGLWLVLGVRSGIWATGFLVSILVLTFFYAILYSVSTLFGVVTRSPIVAILVTVFAWGVLFGVGTLYSALDQTRNPPKNLPGMMVVDDEDEGDEKKPKPPFEKPFPEWLYVTVDTIHYVLPRTRDLSLLNSRLIIKGVLLDDNPKLAELDKTPFNWTESLAVSGAFIAVMLGLACWWFATKDY